MAAIFFAGVVGSRRRNTLHDREITFRLLDWLCHLHRQGAGVCIVSGGCSQGADAFAKEFALKIADPPLDYMEFPIDRTGVITRWDFTKRAYERNRLVAERSDALYCLVHPNRTGGTESTIGHMLALKKPVYLVKADGSVYLTKDGTETSCVHVVDLLGSSSTG